MHYKTNVHHIFRPESFGVLIGCVFLVAMFLFIPVPFTLEDLAARNVTTGGKPTTFPHEDFVELIVALLSICCMILLGFADDVLDLRWRHKLMLPTMATLPLLMVYYVNYNSTTVIMPKFVRSFIGESLDIGGFCCFVPSKNIFYLRIHLYFFRCLLLCLYGHAGRFLH